MAAEAGESAGWGLGSNECANAQVGPSALCCGTPLSTRRPADPPIRRSPLAMLKLDSLQSC